MGTIIGFIGQLLAIVGMIQLMRGVVIGYQALNQVPPAYGFRYMMWSNHWIWLNPSRPPTYLNDEGLRLERRRRRLTLNGLSLWAAAMVCFFVGTFFLSG